ncbi:MAG: hypothetical protein FWD15_04805 [Alphaproteobacteria bacterium]|nr:hypothetical protein [Alphaproteobacteria bacterium]
MLELDEKNMETPWFFLLKNKKLMIMLISEYGPLIDDLAVDVAIGKKYDKNYKIYKAAVERYHEIKDETVQHNIWLLSRYKKRNITDYVKLAIKAGRASKLDLRKLNER